MKTIRTICHRCGISFEKEQKEYNRQINNGRVHFFCSLLCVYSYNKTKTLRIKSTCLWCKNEFETSTHKKARVCCSKSCAVKFAQSKVDSAVHKMSVQRPSLFPTTKVFKCVVCGNNFEKMIKNSVEIKQTCSKKCYGKLVSRWSRNNPNCGGKLGYRRFPYQGYKMDSRWEVEIAKWMDERGITWERSRKKHMFWWNDEYGNKRKYFPDFYLPDLNVYLDPKNDYYLQRDLFKLTQVMDTFKIKLFYGSVELIKQRVLELFT